MIKNIVFDVGNVLVDFRWREYMKDLGFSDEVTEHLGKNMVMNPLWDELDRGLRPKKEVIEEMKSFVPGYEKEADLFFENIEEIVITRSYAQSWLHQLRNQGYKIYLLSNYPADLFETHSKGRFDFLGEIDGMVVSGFVKLVKPEPEIYECLFQKYDLLPEECVFLDDRQINIDAAVRMGMKGILFTDYETVKKELTKLLEAGDNE